MLKDAEEGWVSGNWEFFWQKNWQPQVKGEFFLFLDKKGKICYNKLEDRMRGDNVMSEKTYKIAAAVPADFKEQVDKFCEEKRITVSWLVREAVLEYLKNHSN